VVSLWPGGDSAPALGKQRADLTDGAGDGGAINAEPAAQHIVSDAMSQVDQRGQEPVNEDQLVSGACPDPAPPRPGQQLGLPLGLP
jgi:hypothetical protein